MNCSFCNSSIDYCLINNLIKPLINLIINFISNFISLFFFFFRWDACFLKRFTSPFELCTWRWRSNRGKDTKPLSWLPRGKPPHLQRPEPLAHHRRKALLLVALLLLLPLVVAVPSLHLVVVDLLLVQSEPLLPCGAVRGSCTCRGICIRRCCLRWKALSTRWSGSERIGELSVLFVNYLSLLLIFLSINYSISYYHY